MVSRGLATLEVYGSHSYFVLYDLFIYLLLQSRLGSNVYINNVVSPRFPLNTLDPFLCMLVVKVVHMLKTASGICMLFTFILLIILKHFEAT